MSELKTFYSLCAGLICYPPTTQTVIENGHKTVIDPRPIKFTPLGQGSPSGDKFGSFTTGDPVEIEYLQKRMLEARDVISPEEFNSRLTPPTQDRMSNLEKQVRELQERNTLLERLQTSGKIPATK